MPNDTLAARLARTADRFTLQLVHRGRRTGAEYRVTIWFVVDGTTVWLASADRRRQWVRNVRVNPEIELEVAGERFTGRVEPLDDQALAAAADRVAGKYWFVAPLVWLHRLAGGNGLGPWGTAMRVRLDD
jgi:deazaflavin-dependent oxidoreductase (nitroreductase family)